MGQRSYSGGKTGIWSASFHTFELITGFTSTDQSSFSKLAAISSGERRWNFHDYAPELRNGIVREGPSGDGPSGHTHVDIPVAEIFTRR